MMISIVMLTLIAFGALSWIAESYRHKLGKLVALLGIVLASVVFVLFVSASVNDYHQLTLLTRISWIESLNIEYALALDHLSILLISLTLLLGIICVLVSWYEIKQHSGFYYFNLMATLAGIIGVFTAVDMFLFFVFWEVMLLPMTALIAIWGHENRHFAAIKFFIFTQVSSLLMLIAIIAMAYFHQQATGSLSFYYLE